MSIFGGSIQVSVHPKLSTESVGVRHRLNLLERHEDSWLHSHKPNDRSPWVGFRRCHTLLYVSRVSRYGRCVFGHSYSITMITTNFPSSKTHLLSVHRVYVLNVSTIFLPKGDFDHIRISWDTKSMFPLTLFGEVGIGRPSTSFFLDLLRWFHLRTHGFQPLVLFLLHPILSTLNPLQT